MSIRDTALNPEDRIPEGEAGTGYINPVELIFGTVFLRDKTVLESIYIQCFFLLAGLVGAASIMYFIGVLFVITIHHFGKDRHVYVIPEFISGSEQFEDSTTTLIEEDDEEESDSIY